MIINTNDLISFSW